VLFRSIVFNIVFYLNTLVYLVIALPTFFMSYRSVLAVAKAWSRANLF
jgi:1-acyl-sn-glycerol-3-phosphate acyltransferase